jgi:hypothetical protein
MLAPAYPPCFPDAATYTSWVRLAKRGNEAASPCDDCARAYREAMTREGRCHPVTVRARFKVVGR